MPLSVEVGLPGKVLKMPGGPPSLPLSLKEPIAAIDISLPYPAKAERSPARLAEVTVSPRPEPSLGALWGGCNTSAGSP
jgi:hypothetical protein